MAKKQKIEKTEVETPQTIETVQVEKPTVKKETKPGWEVKDRTYYLIKESPLGYHLRSSALFTLMKKKAMKERLSIVLIKERFLLMK